MKRSRRTATTLSSCVVNTMQRCRRRWWYHGWKMESKMHWEFQSNGNWSYCLKQPEPRKHSWRSRRTNRNCRNTARNPIRRPRTFHTSRIRYQPRFHNRSNQTSQHLQRHIDPTGNRWQRQHIVRRIRFNDKQPRGILNKARHNDHRRPIDILLDQRITHRLARSMEIHASSNHVFFANETTIEPSTVVWRNRTVVSSVDNQITEFVIVRRFSVSWNPRWWCFQRNETKTITNLFPLSKFLISYLHQRTSKQETPLRHCWHRISSYHHQPTSIEKDHAQRSRLQEEITPVGQQHIDWHYRRNSIGNPDSRTQDNHRSRRRSGSGDGPITRKRLDRRKQRDHRLATTTNTRHRWTSSNTGNSFIHSPIASSITGVIDKRNRLASVLRKMHRHNDFIRREHHHRCTIRTEFELAPEADTAHKRTHRNPKQQESGDDYQCQWSSANIIEEHESRKHNNPTRRI